MELHHRFFPKTAAQTVCDSQIGALGCRKKRLEGSGRGGGREQDMEARGNAVL